MNKWKTIFIIQFYLFIMGRTLVNFPYESVMGVTEWHPIR